MASTLYICWRKRLCQKLHGLYFVDNRYYEINVLHKTDLVDNPDQRITQDVDKMSEQLSEILPDLIMAPFVILFYSYQSFMNAGLYGPLGCFLFFLVGTIINKILMSPIVNLVYLQEKFEGIFRKSFLTFNVLKFNSQFRFSTYACANKC